MKNAIIIFMCFCLMFCVNGCKSSVEEPDKLSTTKYSEATVKYYEETANGYKAALYGKDELVAEKIKAWVDSCPSGEKYYQYIYSDADSWDMFIYYFPANDELQYGGFNFSVDDSTVKINVTNDEPVNAVKADYILIRVQAPMRGSWPNSSELYINGEKIEIQNGDLSNDIIPDTETLLLQNLSEIIGTMPEFMQYCKNPVYLSEISRVILAASGDLNSDGNNDLAVVVEFVEENEDSPGYVNGEFGFGARHIYIILGNTDGSYAVTNRNESLILEHLMGGGFGDPLEGVSIENGILSINHYGGSSSRWGYTMRFSYSEGQLVLMDMTELSHDAFTVNIEETICDFANHTVSRYSWGDYESNPLLLFSGELPDKTYFFDDVTFDEIIDYCNI
jgi:hypothetical protein